MRPCFGDTSYFVALLVPNDEYHVAARRWAEESGGPIVTSDYVVWEVGNFVSAQPTRLLFHSFLRVLNSDPRITIVKASPQLMQQGIDLYLARSDKSWSLTDCISFTIMNKKRIIEALTTDHHFGQAGFRMLLKQ